MKKKREKNRKNSLNLLVPYYLQPSWLGTIGVQKEVAILMSLTFVIIIHSLMCQCENQVLIQYQSFYGSKIRI